MSNYWGSLQNAAFANIVLTHHTQQFNACQQNLSSPELVESQHGSGSPFDVAMILLNEVIEVLNRFFEKAQGHFLILAGRQQKIKVLPSESIA
ncbi:protein of unknown function [Xenorhabdus poinarii G6]|uniref:Uncharacterized protein n=1 Tax=Xenorhabdus poinarii G6 TaxID=1354304 RepID=A0A068R504_9GAMM|nr:protein of unknown function [Xenorhabdus poinarii G6]